MTAITENDSRPPHAVGIISLSVSRLMETKDQKDRGIQFFTNSFIYFILFLPCVTSSISQRVGAKDIVENNLIPCLLGAYRLVEDTEVG